MARDHENGNGFSDRDTLFMLSGVEMCIRDRSFLSRGSGDEPHDARNVLPDGRPPRASLYFVSGRSWDRAHDSALHRLSGCLLYTSRCV